MVFVSSVLEEALALLALPDGDGNEVGCDVGDEDLIGQGVAPVPVAWLRCHIHLGEWEALVSMELWEWSRQTQKSEGGDLVIKIPGEYGKVSGLG